MVLAKTKVKYERERGLRVRKENGWEGEGKRIESKREKELRGKLKEGKRASFRD